MQKYCLTKPLANLFKEKLKSGEINPEKLAAMTSIERHNFFKDFLGEENAKNVNSLFESKLLLKSQKTGMINWAKKVTGMTQTTRKSIIEKINSMDKILNPTEEKAFLHDLASTSIGTDVTNEEAKKIFDLSQNTEKLKIAMQSDPTNTKVRIAYGNSVLDTIDYLNKINPHKANIVANLINLPRSLVASLDFVSAPFRHAWGMMSRADFWKNYINMPKYAFSEKAYRNKMADIVSRPTYELMKNGKLSIFGFNDQLSKREEQFMSSLLDKFPITRGSARAYMGFLNGLRADAFDHFIASAELAGEDISKGSKSVKDIANVVNNFTGASNLGRFENIDPYLNNLIFSPRKMVATVQMFNPVEYIKATPTARKQALRNLLGSIGISTTLLVLASMAGAKIETDPTSSDFGQIRIGNTRIDVTGGNRTYITLLARLLTGKTKSTTTDIVTTLGQGYKATTRADVVMSYLRNKLSPTASAISDWLYGSDFAGNPFNLTTELAKLVIPMNITDGMNIFNEDKGNAAMGIALGLFGLPISSYSATTNLNNSQSKEWQGLKAKIGDINFQKVNSDYNSKVQNSLNRLQKSHSYQQLSTADQQALVTKIKTNIKTRIFRSYGYKYKVQKKAKNPTVKELINNQ